MENGAEGTEQPQIIQQQRHYSYGDLMQFQSTQAYSSIGKMLLSHKNTEPAYSFGSATREKQEKIFQNKEMSKTQFLGKKTPGPHYNVRGADRFYYNQPPEYSVGTAVRNTLDTKAKYAYYGRPDTEFEPLEADKTRRPKSSIAKIGLESRFVMGASKMNQTPGPEYNPGFRPDSASDPRYTFGFRREIRGYSPIAPNTSTPLIVGPGRYYRDREPPNTSIMPDAPKVGFTKQRKFLATSHDPQKNQTYDTTSSIGFQIRSQKKTMPTIGIPKAKRDYKPGLFKQHMSTQPTKIRIPHPKF